MTIIHIQNVIVTSQDYIWTSLNGGFTSYGVYLWSRFILNRFAIAPQAQVQGSSSWVVLGLEVRGTVLTLKYEPRWAGNLLLLCVLLM